MAKPVLWKRNAEIICLWRQPRLNTRTIRSLSSSNHDPRHAIIVAQTMTVDRLQRYVAARLSQHDSKIVVATGTRAAQILGHNR